MVNLKEELLKKWAITQDVKEDLKEPIQEKVLEEKSPLQKVKQKHEANKKSYANVDELTEQARIAQLEQEISKAENLKYKTEQERLKLKRAAGDLIEFDLAEYLFIGFMARTNAELLRLMKKIEPVIVNMCNENNPKGVIKRITRDIESIMKDIKDQQAEEILKWKKDL